MFDIVTFGSAVVDIFVDTHIKEKGRFIAYPVGSKILLENLRFDIGGGGTNTAVAFSRLGLKTGWIGKVGSDSNGRFILDFLSKENVKFLGVVQNSSLSGHSIILDSLENNRTILTYKGVNDNLSLEEIKTRKIKTKWLYLSSMLGKSYVSQKKIVSLLKKRGVKIAFNPSEYLIKEKDLRGLLKLVDILILNKEEAELLLKQNRIKYSDLSESIWSFIDRGLVVITNKDKRIVCYDGSKKYWLMPNKVKAVERTGAGDAFASGFVAGQVVGKSVDESLKLGLEESEAVIKHFGAKNNLIHKKIK